MGPRGGARPDRAGTCADADRTIASIAITTVVFDWYGTLAAPNPDDWWPRLGELIRAAGGTPLPEVLSQWDDGHPVDHPEHSTSEASYRAWQRDRLATVLVASDVTEPARTELLDEIDHVRYTRVFDLYPDVVPTLTALRADGVTIGVCSNWNWDLDRHLTRTGIVGLLDFTVCSARAGTRKPSKQIFATVLDRAGERPDRVLFVGDSWRDDIDGAATVGMRGLHLVRDGECPVAAHADVPCAADLSPVLALTA